MNIINKDLYFVAVKLFIEKDGKLFIFKDKYGDWDLPGGRIRINEFETPLEKIIERKMREELGEEISYIIGKPIVFMRHQRNEVDLDGQEVRIFAVGFEATLNSGEIKISDMHTKMEWVDIKTFKPEDYFTGGWLNGVEDYLALKNQ
jgi:ADP-ribose pyrophosphatase YjhB (NUDIX family)